MKNYEKVVCFCLNFRKKFLVLLLFLLSFIPTSLLFAKQKPIASIPFEMVGSYVVLKVKINDSPPLNLIIDTGIRNTLITELMPEDNITLNYSDVRDLMGLGEGKKMGALKSNFNTVHIGKLKFHPKTVYVLEQDIFNLSMHTGSKINGLIGIEFFQNHIFEIDYTAYKVRFYNNDTKLELPKGFSRLPLIIEGQKMYVVLSVVEKDGVQKNVKMLLDTGAELNAWFQTYKTEAIKIPEKNIRGSIGQGLNGEIVGSFGKISQLYFGDFCIENPIVSFPDSSTISYIVNNSDRHGTVGSQILCRFNLFFDIKNELIYFKPNENFKRKFSYNIAGIEIMQILPNVPQAEVWLVWENSPAAIAGVKVGDQIIEINGVNAFQYTINDLKGMFETPSKTPIKLTLLRDGTEVMVSIDMKSRL